MNFTAIQLAVGQLPKPFVIRLGAWQISVSNAPLNWGLQRAAVLQSGVSLLLLCADGSGIGIFL